MPTIVTANCYRLLSVKPLWITRRAKLVSVLESVYPDFVCVQECTETQERYILTELDGAWGSASDYVNVGVMYRSDRYKLEESRPFKLLNKNPKNRKRYASAAILRSYDSSFGPDPFCVVSAHLASSGDGSSASTRPYQAQQLIDQLKPWAGDMPTILAGDWNEAATNGSVAHTLEAAGFIEDRKILSQIGATAIDRFFVNKGMTITSSSALSSEKASDHDFRQMNFSLTNRPVPIAMWVRPFGDPVWTDLPPNRIFARDDNGEFTEQSRINDERLEGFGTQLTAKGESAPDAFFRVAPNENYRLSYLTAIDPSLPPAA